MFLVVSKVFVVVTEIQENNLRSNTTAGRKKRSGDEVKHGISASPALRKPQHNSKNFALTVIVDTAT